MGQRLWKMNDIILNILILCCLGCGQKVSFWTSQYHTRFRQTFSETSIVILCINFNFLGWFRRSQFLQPTRNYRELVSEFFSIGQCNWQQSSQKKKNPGRNGLGHGRSFVTQLFIGLQEKTKKKKKKRKKRGSFEFLAIRIRNDSLRSKMGIIIVISFF